MPVYLQNIDGTKIPLAVDSEGRLVLSSSEPITIGGQPEVNLWAYNGSTWERTNMDGVTQVLAAIEYEHHKIHDGCSFVCHYHQLVSDINDRSIITFRTSDTTKWLHIVIDGTSTALADFRILEAPNVVNNTGAPLTVFNRDRNSAITSTVWDTSQNPDVQGQATYFTEVTMGNVTGGTAFRHYTLGGVGGGSIRQVGGGARGVNEFILRRNTLYAVEIKSLTADDNYHEITASWYEHTNK